ncbi:hypothetical protein Zmor_004083 [Zophobas morio]|uniref:Tf2-1-like SH3-like domain-containing protein n=1 Tax=Zophobas morio TaxID=2755281 RepID=A0AA38M0H1_9CUCU|nr:hypothetical protein Zmor_004083 [Zophobas morio]
MEPDIEHADIVQLRERLLVIQAQAVDNISKRQKYDKQRYDSKHREVDFEVGENVKVFVPIRRKGKSPKLMCKWFGPYKVLRKVSAVNYELEMGTKQKPEN